VTAEDLAVLLDRELTAIAADDRRDGVHDFMVEPFPRQLESEYDRHSIECWVVAQSSDLQIVYSDEGFGGSYLWGIVAASRKWAGRDDDWFVSLDDAFINSGLWKGLLPDDYEVS
jgi:hypothetical protein